MGTSIRGLFALSMTVAGVGCYEGIRDAPQVDQASSGEGGSTGEGEESGDGPVESTRVPGRLRRLTRVELDNTIVDLFGEQERGVALAGLDLEPQSGAFYNAYEDLWADRAFLEKYIAVTDGLAERAVHELDEWHACAWDQEDAIDGCVRGLLDGFGTKLFRRPLTAAEVERFTGSFEDARAENSLDESLHSLVHALLLSPAFLYRDETLIGRYDETPTADYQMATQLSYLLWASTPDDELLAAAAAGRLRTRDEIRAQAERLLADPRGRVGLLQFFEQLFDFPKYELISKDAAEHGEFDESMRDEMKDELRAFVGHVVFEGEGTLHELLTAPYSFVGERLASIYGVTATPDSALPTPLPSDQRAGLLTQPGFLAFTSPASGTKPVMRGNFVLERLLCIELGPPPEDMIMLPEEVEDADMSTREKFEAHIERPDCAACHRYIDPIGFGLEEYDGLGRYRTHEGEHPIDAQGDLKGAGSQDGSFVGGRELAERLAASEVTHGCFARQYFRFALGRREVDHEAEHIEQLVRGFVEADLDVKALMLDIVESELFRARGTNP